MDPTALIVEDGTGVPMADAYVAVAELRQFAANFGYVIADTNTDATLGVKIRQATAWIDTAFRYKGTRLTNAQALEFPRDGLVDWSSQLVTGVPLRVKRACCELAFKAIADGNLFKDLDRGGMVVHKQVGPISTTYAPDAPAQKVYQQAQGYLEQYVRAMDYVLAAPQSPAFDTPAEPDYFHANMMHNPNIGTGIDPQE